MKLLRKLRGSIALIICMVIALPLQASSLDNKLARAESEKSKSKEQEKSKSKDCDCCCEDSLGKHPLSFFAEFTLLVGLLVPVNSETLDVDLNFFVVTPSGCIIQSETQVVTLSLNRLMANIVYSGPVAGCVALSAECCGNYKFGIDVTSASSGPVLEQTDGIGIAFPVVTVNDNSQIVAVGVINHYGFDGRNANFAVQEGKLNICGYTVAPNECIKTPTCCN